MRKIFLITLILYLSFSLCFSIPKPKNDNVGVLIGKTYLEYDKDIGEMSAGKYYKVEVVMFNKTTRKKLSTMANKNGIFYFLNLEPGEYLLLGVSYQYQAGNTIFTLGGYFGEKGQDLIINSKKITALKTLGIMNEVLPIDESRDKATDLHTILRTEKRLVREENLDELKEFFKNFDKQNQWSNFEWVYEGK